MGNYQIMILGAPSRMLALPSPLQNTIARQCLDTLAEGGIVVYLLAEDGLRQAEHDRTSLPSYPARPNRNPPSWSKPFTKNALATNMWANRAVKAVVDLVRCLYTMITVTRRMPIDPIALVSLTPPSLLPCPSERTTPLAALKSCSMMTLRLDVPLCYYRLTNVIRLRKVKQWKPSPPFLQNIRS